ncbi:MAG: CinA family protein [Dehalococcoidia bacterium]|nr:MAG: CinA family protein [Dehalococcoidia bacterium]
MTETHGYEYDVVTRMTKRGLTLATAETSVGGLIGHLITNVPGASKVFIGGVTGYARRPKVEVMHADAETLRTHGAESEEAVRAMARGVREVMQTDVVIAESGYANPTPTADRPGGLYFIGILADGEDRVGRYVFPGDREATKAAAAQEALRLVLAYLDRLDREGVPPAAAKGHA